MWSFPSSFSFPDDFTPGQALLGGTLIAAAALLYLVEAGRRVGISGTWKARERGGFRVRVVVHASSSHRSS